MNIDLTDHQPFIHYFNLLANPMSVFVLIVFILLGAGALYLTDMLSAMRNRV